MNRINGRYSTHSSFRAATVIVVCVASFLATDIQASAPEYISAEQPAPGSVDDETGPMEELILIEVPEPSLFPGIKKRLEKAAPFWRDTRLLMHPRVYYFDRDRENANDSEALAYGGWLGYESGWWQSRLRLGAKLYTSQRAYGPNDKDGTLLLKEGQKGITVLGEANIEVKLTDTLFARLYRQSFNIPYLNRNDSRMVPNTFEAYTVRKRPADDWELLLTHVRQIKLRNRDDFISMSEAAGLADRDEPLSAAAIRYDFTDKINIGVTSQYAWEFMNTLYAEANAAWRLENGGALRLGAQYTDQRSVGDEIGGDFDTYVYGAKMAGSYSGATVTLAFSSTDDDAGIRNPYGGYPGYLSLMIKSFNRPDEDAWLVGLSYDFEEVGIPGLSSFANYARGYVPDSRSNSLPDQRELDVTVDYRFQAGLLKGLWLRARTAFVNQDNNVAGATDVRDYRIILNYELPIL